MSTCAHQCVLLHGFLVVQLHVRTETQRHVPPRLLDVTSGHHHLWQFLDHLVPHVPLSHVYISMNAFVMISVLPLASCPTITQATASRKAPVDHKDNEAGVCVPWCMIPAHPLETRHISFNTFFHPWCISSLRVHSFNMRLGGPR